ncbi:hypothetical protein D3C72_806000 [compost metagenome]
MTSIDRRTASNLLVQTYAHDGHEVKALLSAVVDLLAVARLRTGDLDASLLLMSLLERVIHAPEFRLMTSLDKLMATPPGSPLWTRERELAEATGIGLGVTRRRIARLAEDGLLVRRDDAVAPHPEAMADPRFGFDQIMRLAVRAR